MSSESLAAPQVGPGAKTLRIFGRDFDCRIPGSEQER